MMKRRRIPNERKEGIIDLTDFGNRNKTSVTRETRFRLDPKSDYIGVIDSSAIHVIPEDKGLAYSKPLELQDPEDSFEEQLETEGASIIESTTYFPASGTTVTKRSQTVEERAEERMFDNHYYYNDR